MNRQLAASVFMHAAEIADARVTADPSDLASRSVAKMQYIRAGHYDDARRESIKRTERAVMIHAAAKAVVIVAAIVAAYNVLRWFFA